MTISPEHLPVELHYMIPLAEQHGSDAPMASYDEELGRHVTYAETLSDEEIKPIRELYTQIRANNHGPVISDWYHNHFAQASADTTWPIYGLLVLFQLLGDLGIEPFDDGTVRFKEKEEVLDWSKLPASLSYLIEPAEKYGAIQFEDKIFAFLSERMTPAEKTELQALSKTYVQDEGTVNDWLDEYNMTKHPEARLVYFTGNLLALGNDAGLL